MLHNVSKISYFCDFTVHFYNIQILQGINKQFLSSHCFYLAVHFPVIWASKVVFFYHHIVMHLFNKPSFVTERSLIENIAMYDLTKPLHIKTKHPQEINIHNLLPFALITQTLAN